MVGSFFDGWNLSEGGLGCLFSLFGFGSVRCNPLT